MFACSLAGIEVHEPLSLRSDSPNLLKAHHVCDMLRGCPCRYSTSNTRSGIESCGILAGSLREKQGVFVISTLIIPKQEGTSDTVQALNEEEIFDVQDKRALYPLGWIHTHPTQTCFLSSVDVHTQCGYQVRCKANCQSMKQC